jgi:hypothetical protein
MNQLTVQQRKIAYAIVAVLCFMPIILLGAPAGPEEGSGWLLARSRYHHELGEASLGNVDPTSATMNLVLLGLRGVAASVLWMQADHYKDTKNFNQLEDTVESIILLQPHFKSVWEFQAWNLAFNVSAECDDVADRYHWVKRGAKFLVRGTRRNEKVPELKFMMGTFFGQKIGRADEKEVFRRYFINDPDEERWKGDRTKRSTLKAKTTTWSPATGITEPMKPLNSRASNSTGWTWLCSLPTPTAA